MMQCVICKGTAFSVRPSDINKPPAERYSKYGDCCSMVCALRKTTAAFRKDPERYKGLKLEGCGKTYIVMVPDAESPKSPKASFTRQTGTTNKHVSSVESVEL